MVGHGKPWFLKQDFLRPVCFASGWNLDDGELQREFHLPSDSLSRPPPEKLLWFSVHYHKIFWHFWTCWPKGLQKHGAMPSKNARNHAQCSSFPWQGSDQPVSASSLVTVTQAQLGLSTKELDPRPALVHFTPYCGLSSHVAGEWPAVMDGTRCRLHCCVWGWNWLGGSVQENYSNSLCCLCWVRALSFEAYLCGVLPAVVQRQVASVRFPGIYPSDGPSFTVLSCLTRYDHCDHAAQMVVALAFCSKTSAVFALSAHRSGWHEDYYCGSTKSAELKLWGDASWTCQACYHLGHRLVCLPAEVPGRTDDVWVPSPQAVPLQGAFGITP